MTKINNIEYKNQKEFLDALVFIGKSADYMKEFHSGERYRAPGWEALFFRNKKEAATFYNIVKNRKK